MAITKGCGLFRRWCHVPNIINDGKRRRMSEIIKKYSDKILRFSIAGEDEVARELKEKVRVLCWVMTGPKNHDKKAIHVKRTWGKRCNILIFMSSKEGNNVGGLLLYVRLDFYLSFNVLC